MVVGTAALCHPLLVETSEDSELMGRYHGVDDAPYNLPNDEPEISRLDELHCCMKNIMGANILPKIKDNPSLIGYSPSRLLHVHVLGACSL